MGSFDVDVKGTPEKPVECSDMNVSMDMTQSHGLVLESNSPLSGGQLMLGSQSVGNSPRFVVPSPGGRDSIGHFFVDTELPKQLQALQDHSPLKSPIASPRSPRSLGSSPKSPTELVQEQPSARALPLKSPVRSKASLDSFFVSPRPTVSSRLRESITANEIDEQLEDADSQETPQNNSQEFVQNTKAAADEWRRRDSVAQFFTQDALEEQVEDAPKPRQSGSRRASLARNFSLEESENAISQGSLKNLASRRDSVAQFFSNDNVKEDFKSPSQTKGKSRRDTVSQYFSPDPARGEASPAPTSYSRMDETMDMSLIADQTGAGDMDASMDLVTATVSVTASMEESVGPLSQQTYACSQDSHLPIDSLGRYSLSDDQRFLTRSGSATSNDMDSLANAVWPTASQATPKTPKPALAQQENAFDSPDAQSVTATEDGTISKFFPAESTPTNNGQQLNLAISPVVEPSPIPRRRSARKSISAGESPVTRSKSKGLESPQAVSTPKSAPVSANRRRSTRKSLGGLFDTPPSRSPAAFEPQTEQEKSQVIGQIRAVDSPTKYSLPTDIERKVIIDQIRSVESPLPLEKTANIEKQDKVTVQSEEEYLASVFQRKKAAPAAEVAEASLDEGKEQKDGQESKDAEVDALEAGIETPSELHSQETGLATPMKDPNESAFRETNGLATNADLMDEQMSVIDNSFSQDVLPITESINVATLDDFIAATGIELETVELPPPLTWDKSEAEAELLDYLKAAALYHPEITIYRFGCQELEKFVGYGMEEIENWKKEIAAEPPICFMEYAQGTEQERGEIVFNVQQLKLNCFEFARNQYYEWRKQLLAPHTTSLEDIIQKLEGDELILDECARDLECLKREASARLEGIDQDLKDMLEM